MGEVRDLPYELNPEIGHVTAVSPLGELPLDELTTDPRARLQGFIVVHEGKIVYEQYPGMTETDTHIWMSSSKSVASLLVGLLEADGLIDVSKPIETYLPEFAGSQWESISIIDIMDMAPGLDSVENMANIMDLEHPFSKWTRLLLGDHEGLGDLTATEAILAVEDNSALGAGEKFEYSSMNTTILGMLAERVSGKRLADLLTERVWSKIGAEGDALLGLDPSGQPAIFGFISSRLRDKARYGMIYTPSWSVVSDEKIVPDSLIEKTQKECRPALYQRTLKSAEDAGYAWPVDPEIRCNSRQWDAVYVDGDMYKGGVHGQGIYVSPSRDVVVAYFSTTPMDWQPYARAISKALAP